MPEYFPSLFFFFILFLFRVPRFYLLLHFFRWFLDHFIVHYNQRLWNQHAHNRLITSQVKISPRFRISNSRQSSLFFWHKVTSLENLTASLVSEDATFSLLTQQPLHPHPCYSNQSLIIKIHWYQRLPQFRNPSIFAFEAVWWAWWVPCLRCAYLK